MAWISIRIIKAYQKVSHTFFPRTCRFHPSCSQYALESIQMYGFLKGAFKALGRILKCSPLSGGGYDPVR
ncbi:MAG: membrane protein insertion efficiency factor YidD [Candidatus Omnitrophica bacterium]|nr:membrane protein insertion efficiency factor YidD [Candidatus Omnitrophota bacterium]